MYSIIWINKTFSGILVTILLRDVSGLLKLLMGAPKEIWLKDGISILFLKKLKQFKKSTEKKARISRKTYYESKETKKKKFIIKKI
jgi:hypothetical protein